MHFAQKLALINKLNDVAPGEASDNMHLVADVGTTETSSTSFHLGAKSERTAAVDVATPMG